MDRDLYKLVSLSQGPIARETPIRPKLINPVCFTNFRVNQKKKLTRECGWNYMVSYIQWQKL